MQLAAYVRKRVCPIIGIDFPPFEDGCRALFESGKDHVYIYHMKQLASIEDDFSSTYLFEGYLANGIKVRIKIVDGKPVAYCVMSDNHNLLNSVIFKG